MSCVLTGVFGCAGPPPSTEASEDPPTGLASADPQFGHALLDAVADAARGRLESATGLARAAERRAVELGDLDAALRAAVLPGLWRLWATGEAEESIASVDSALARYPMADLLPPRRVDTILAAFFADAGDPGRGRAFLSRFVQDSRRPLAGRMAELPSSYHGARGAIGLAEGRPTEAIRALARASASEPRGPLAPDFRLALAWERAGARDSATRIYERFIGRFASATADSRPSGADAWAVPYALTSLGELYEERGDAPTAAAYLERFVQLWEGADSPLQDEVREMRERLSGLRGRASAGG